jgi:hypothetical protein
MIRIARFEEGICLNQKEYVLDGPSGDIVEFKDKDAAMEFLKKNSNNPEFIQEDLDSGSIMLVDSETDEVL